MHFILTINMFSGTFYVCIHEGSIYESCIVNTAKE